ncbi:hypothetical protein MSG28_010732 [Choristoneura fumiferana]|uniref:Uncharacterized protein n=1 Tax=Choristoneura fumiferana TaxID=7141 RepID=A0ACC0KP61_CHOFU|nr:hypothetical protein MSG28_010732 [Choristoneura fumiferana]
MDYTISESEIENKYLLISESDPLPNLICQSCLDLLNQLYYFKRVVCRSDDLLRQQYKLKQDGQPNENYVNELEEQGLQEDSSSSPESSEPTFEEVPPKTKRKRRVYRKNTEATKKKDRMKCIKCDKRFQKYETLEAHMRNDHVSLMGAPSFSLRKGHIKKVLMALSDVGSESQQLTWPLCMGPKPPRTLLKSEFRAHSNNKWDKSSTFWQISHRGRSEQTPSRQTCTILGLIFAFHQARLRPNPDIKCPECDKTFLTFRSLSSHSRTHSGVRKYQCLTCGKDFAYLNVLKNHELIHAGIKKHACHICDAKFVQAHNLKMHIETHKNERNYGCYQCGKKFAQPGNLKIHLIRHTGIKNYGCTQCEMKFYIKADLVKHMRSHSTDKPFSCQMCDKTFKSRSFMAIHMRTHTGERPYACDLCPKKFMARKDLRNHRMIHTGEKPHKCQLCSQAFIQKCALNRHMKGHMREEAVRPHEVAAPLAVSYAEWRHDT